MSLLKTLRMFIVLGLLSLIFIGCVYNPPHHSSVTYRSHSGHAEPWGYYYYPDTQVYFHFSTGFYYYPTGSTWVRTRFLPRHIHLNPDIRVQLHIKSNKPYAYHRQHHEKYRGRSRHAPAPKVHRQEREYHRGHKERQHRSIEELRFSPKLKQEKHQPPIRFDSPPQHKPIPFVPKHEQEKARQKKSKQQKDKHQKKNHRTKQKQYEEEH